jgi:hypothetical protein
MEKCNPLIEAVEIYEKLLDAEGHAMYHVGGDECLDNFDQELCGDVQNLISSTSDAIRNLSPRVKRARLNLVWKDFVREQQEKRQPASPITECVPI